ncbi:MAG: ferritin-like domain-containing protein [Minicystis sp.]
MESHAAFVAPRWTLEALQQHLQAAVDLELWTIPFYMSVLYSLQDPSDEAFALILSVVNQEMLHLQSAANVSNAYGLEVTITPPQYVGTQIPHLDFALDHPNPADPVTGEFYPYTAEIGPLDREHANAMCLIEYPRWGDHQRRKALAQLRPTVQEYGSIGEFYAALQLGMRELASHLRGGKNQIGMFTRNYQGAAPSRSQFVVTHDGEQGLKEALALVEMITTQGEGDARDERDIPTMYQNTADDSAPNLAHFEKFESVRERVFGNPEKAPRIYHGEAHPPEGSPGRRAQDTLVKDFAVLCDRLQIMFRTGVTPEDFGPVMFKVGAGLTNCWKNDAIPRFSKEH